MFVHTGDYMEHVNDDALRSTYYTFTPLPLMEGNFYTMDEDLAALLAGTYRTLGTLAGMLLSLPERELFTDIMLFRESCFSEMIDYPDIDIHSRLIKHGLKNLEDDVQNIVSAYQYAINTDIRKIGYNSIVQYALYGNDQNHRAMPRTKPLFLAKATANYRKYNPTAPNDIHPALNDIRKYTESDGIDTLIKAAMCHYQFEMIHPYECYNGIAGRILVYAILSGSGLSEAHYLNLSEYLFSHKEEYFETMGLAQKNGRYSAWIDFFIRAVGESARNSVESVKTYQKIILLDEKKLAEYHGRTRHMEKIYRYFKTNVVSTVKQASSELHLPYNIVARAIETLQNMEILSQVTERARNRLFAHTGLKRLILSE